MHFLVNRVHAEAHLNKLINSIFTPDPGLSEIYKEKVSEAEALLEDGRSSAPLLKGEAAVRDVEPADLAKQVLDKRDECRERLIKLELLRTELKLATKDITDPEKEQEICQDIIQRASEI